MAAYLSGIFVKSRVPSTHKIMLGGYVKDLEDGKHYCLMFMGIHDFDQDHIQNNNFSYTYITGPGTYNLGNAGCFMPDEGDGTYSMIIREVGSTCESVITPYVDTAGIIVASDVPPETEYVYVDIHVKDQHGNYVKYCTVTIPGATSGDILSTGSDGVVTFKLEKGKSYVATAKPPTGYSSISTSTGSFVAIGTQSFMRTLQKDAEPDPTPTTCVLSFAVICIDPMTLMSGVTCRVGGKSAITGPDGTCNITVECGKPYTATCDTPDGYNCICPTCVCSDGPFTPTGNGSIDTFYIAKNAIPDDDTNGNTDGVPTYKNIPPEVVAVMPEGTTNIIILSLKRLVILGVDLSSITTLKSHLPSFIGKVGDIITYKELIGWSCLGADVLELSDGSVVLPIFIRKV